MSTKGLREQFHGKIQFATSASMPFNIYQACLKTGIASGTVYVQRAVCEALARDLGLDLDDLLAELPRPRTSANTLLKPKITIGPGQTTEEVK